MNRLAGAATLTRFALRRDRILLPAWVAVFTVMTVFSASATMALYPDEATRAQAAAAVNDVPVAVALYGRIWDPTSLGALSLLKMAAMGTVMVAILAIMLVTRHARAEEEKGRTELVGASPVGAWAQLAAAVAVAAIAMAGVGILSAVGLTLVGLPAAGAWAFGLSWTLTGLAFAAVSAVTNQLTVSARAATSLAVVAVAVAYLVRAVGDVLGDADGPTWLSWLSPIGWSQQVRSFAGDRFLVLLLPVVVTLLLLALAVLLHDRRDLGGGLLPERGGRAEAAPGLRSPMALAWRLQYPMLVGWLVAYLVMGAIVGSIVNDLGDMMDTPQAQQMMQALGGTDVMLDAFIAMEFSILAFVTAAYGITASRRLVTEETDGHLEPLLATAVSRGRFLAGHLTVALVGTIALTLAQGAAFSLALAAQTGDSSTIGSTVGAAMAYLPAVWLMTGLVVLLFGFAPRLTYWAWVLLVAFVLVSELGALLEWPAWVMNLSPFTHVPLLPAESMQWAPLLALLGIATAFAVVGAARFRQRDLASP